MESSSLSDTGSPEPSSDFGFAFNDVNFSDRILRIEILPDLPGVKPDPDDNIGDWARNRKRRRNDQLSNTNEPSEQREEQILGGTMPDLDDNYEDEAVAMIEEGSGIARNRPGHEVARDNESSSGTNNPAVQVKTIHISSPILAAKSPFFYKLFSNATKESEEQRDVTLQIQASEEEALMHLLNFMYSNTLPITSSTALLDVLMAADKFEVASCMRYCSKLLRNIPMTCESALLYLDLPSSVLMANTVQQLTDAAKQFLAARFKDLTKSPEDVLNLPLAGIEAVLYSDDLQVASEDAVFDFVVKWTRLHYPKFDDRREILSTRLLRFVRFPCMSCRKLKKVLTCSEIDPDLASKVVLDALFFKAETPHRLPPLPSPDDPNSSSSNRRFVERSYKYRPVKVVVFDSPRQQCVVYLDLKREECAGLFPSGRIYSQAFHLGGQGFFLSGHCNNGDQAAAVPPGGGGGYNCFGLFLGMQEKGAVAFPVDYEFAVRTKPSEDFVSKYKAKYVFTGGKAVGYRNLFSTPWAAFIAEDSPFFINGVLHLRAELTMKKAA